MKRRITLNKIIIINNRCENQFFSLSEFKGIIIEDTSNDREINVVVLNTSIVVDFFL